MTQLGLHLYVRVQANPSVATLKLQYLAACFTIPPTSDVAPVTVLTSTLSH